MLIDNVLDTWAAFDPRRILYKMKLHRLAHLVEDIRRHGPSPLYATEIFECWNAIFRMCSVLSNHMAPSRDIALTLADMERFKHQISGGWWKNGGGQWIQAGRKVRHLLQNNNQIQRRLGWTNNDSIQAGKLFRLLRTGFNNDLTVDSAGTVKLAARAQQKGATLSSILADAGFSPVGDVSFSSIREWSACKNAISVSGDSCMTGSFVFFKKEVRTCLKLNCGNDWCLSSLKGHHKVRESSPYSCAIPCTRHDSSNSCSPGVRHTQCSRHSLQYACFGPNTKCVPCERLSKPADRVTQKYS